MTVVQTVSHFVIALCVDRIEPITPDKMSGVESNGSVNKPFANNPLFAFTQQRQVDPYISRVCPNVPDEPNAVDAL